MLVGRGDPNISGRNLPYNVHTERSLPPMQVLQQLADQVAQRGVKFIDGDVIGDSPISPSSAMVKAGRRRHGVGVGRAGVSAHHQ